jgi:hypothetical protein
MALKSFLIDTVYSELVKSVLMHGADRPDGGKELMNVGFKISDARNSVINNPTLAINKKDLVKYMLEFVVAANMLVALDEVAVELRTATDTMNALGNLYFKIRKSRLDITIVGMEGNLIRNTPTAIPIATFLQSILACWLNIEIGECYGFTGNVFIEEDDIQLADRVAGVEWNYSEINDHFQRMPNWDINDLEGTAKQIGAALYVLDGKGTLADSGLTSKVLLDLLTFTCGAK